MAKIKEPLTESYFYILLSLYKGENHGYGIMQETIDLTDNRVIIGSGTMYGAINNMLKRGWIHESQTREANSRKRLYKITDLGKEVFNEEYARLKALIDNAKSLLGGVL
ncbi:MAG: PadR family transcriptional regulator [Clostridiales bacterium]|nr:PadR family transcriptional regulator [Clostridiales bacterium]